MGHRERCAVLMKAQAETACPHCGALAPCECPERKLVYKIPPAISTPPFPFPKADKPGTIKKKPPAEGG